MKTAVWYHGVLSGPRIHNEGHALNTMYQQMTALHGSGLSEAAGEVHVGINGNDRDVLTAFALCPKDTILHTNGESAQSELATLKELQAWLKPGWAVCYHHLKGVSYPGNPVYDRWRKCMENAVIWGWRECHMLLEAGKCESCGAHWLTHRKYAMVDKSHRYWGGNFWWATSDYLMTLPPVPKDSWGQRYDAEVWIGSGRRAPVVYDFSPHWPMSCPV